MGSRPGHRVSRSFNGIRTSVVMLRMAPPFSPSRDFNRSTADCSPRFRNCKRLNSPAVIPPRDRGFESQEPTSPKISCIGHIKAKPQQRVKPSKEGRGGSVPDRAVQEINKLSKLKTFILGRHHKNKQPEEEEGRAVQGEEVKNGCPSLGQIKRYTSGSHDAEFRTMFVQERPILSKFGSVYVEKSPIVAKSESFMLEAVPKEEEGGINIWKRRCIPPLKALEVNPMIRAERFEPRKPFTT